MKVQRTCKCGKKYIANAADLKRGWGKSCSKSCAAKRREKKLDRFNYQGGGSRADHEFRHALDGETFNDAHLFSNEE